MGLREELQTDIKEAFDKDLSDGVKSAILRKRDKSGTVYDPTTGLSATGYTDYATRGIFMGYSQLERANTHIMPTDIAFIIIANELSIEPETKDHLVFGTTIYNVLRYTKDPVTATYTLHLRTS